MTPCKIYSKAFISRFADNEVPKPDHDAFARHVEDCGACASILAAYRQMDHLFDAHADSQVEQIRKNLPPITLKKKTGIFSRLFSGLKGTFKGSMGLPLKLASLSAAAIILAVSLYPWQNDPMPGPSAIVNSVDTYGSSVMIIETTNTQHTIIWFSET